jgi:hypothetical protein
VIYTGINLPNGTYKWRVQDYGAYGYGSWTALQQFILNRTFSVVLGSPSGTLTSWDDSFHWTGILGAKNYLVQVQNASGTVIKNKWFKASDFCNAALSCNVIYTGINLPNGTYKWRVQDYGAYGYGSWTALQQFILNR